MNYVQCDKPQKRCVVKDSELAYGDKVGFFDRAGKLRAIGQVKENVGARRSVKVLKKYGMIANGVDVALLSNDIHSTKDAPKYYNIYRPHTKNRIGISMGSASLNNGDFQKGLEYGAYYQRNFTRYLSASLNSNFLAGEGDITRQHYQKSLDTQTMNTYAFSIFPAIGVNYNQQNLIGFRGKVGAGFSYVAADIGGRTDLMEDEGFSPTVHNGMQMYLRGQLGLSLNLKSFSVEADLAKSQLDEAIQTTLGVGLSKSL